MTITQIVTIAIPLLLAVIAGAYVMRAKGEISPEVADALHSTQAASDSDRFLAGLANPLLGTPAARVVNDTALYRTLNEQLIASGGMYGGSVEMYVSIQIASVFLSAISLLVLTAFSLPFMFAVPGILLLLALSVYPTFRLREAVKKRTSEIRKVLPDFAELLMMCLSVGISIRAALKTAAENSPPGLVRTEVEQLLALLANQSVREEEAYKITGLSLGTTDSQALFNILSQGDLQTSPVRDNISRLATQMRSAEYQRRRQENGKLPIKFVIVMSLHLLPLLFAVTIVPALLGFGGAF